MKKRISGIVASILFTVGGPAFSEVGIYSGVTVNDHWSCSFDQNANESKVMRQRSKDTQIALISTLGNSWYALYQLDRKNKVAYKYAGTFSKGPTYFENIKLRGGKTQTFELWKTFNASWDEDLDLDTSFDTMNYKAGQLSGPRSLVPLKMAGFPIAAARTMKGAHTHTRCSDVLAPTLADPTIFGSGKFFEQTRSKSTFRLQRTWTDSANAVGGQLSDGEQVVEDYLAGKNFTVQPIGSFNPAF